MSTRINYRKKIPISKVQKKYCSVCFIDYDDETKNFCPKCGNKLKMKTSEVYANVGKKGITSISCKQDGVTINSKGDVTIPVSKGISITTNPRKKK